MENIMMMNLRIGGRTWNNRTPHRFSPETIDYGPDSFTPKRDGWESEPPKRKCQGCYEVGNILQKYEEKIKDLERLMRNYDKISEEEK